MDGKSLPNPSLGLNVHRFQSTNLQIVSGSLQGKMFIFAPSHGRIFLIACPIRRIRPSQKKTDLDFPHRRPSLCETFQSALRRANEHREDCGRTWKNPRRNHDRPPVPTDRGFYF